MPKRLVCVAVVLGLLISSSANAIFIGDFPGLSKLIDTADAIVILRTEDCITGYNTKPPYYKEYRCAIYQSLKGDIPQSSVSNPRINLKLFDPEMASKTPFAHGASHLMFLSKKVTDGGQVEYYSLCMKGTYVPLPSMGNEKMPEGDTLEEKVRNVIKGAIEYENQQHEKKQAFLNKMLGGKYVDLKGYNEQAAKEALVFSSLSNRNDLQELSEQESNDFNKYGGDQLFEMTLYFYQHHKHAKAVQAGEKLLKKQHMEGFLTDAQDAMVRYYMAKSYEALQDGFRAKTKYRQIQTMHREYCRNIEIAYRLGELNSSIIMDGTQPNEQEAIKWHRYVIENYEHPEIVYYEVLKSHMGLGILLWSQKDYGDAARQFEAICKTNPAFAAPSPYQYFENDYDRDDHIEWLQDRVEGIRKKAKEKLVNVRFYSDNEKPVINLETDTLSEQIKEKWQLEVQGCSIDEEYPGRHGIYVGVKYSGVKNVPGISDYDVIITHRVKSASIADILFPFDGTGEVSVCGGTASGKFYLPEEIKGLAKLTPGTYPVSVILEGEIYRKKEHEDKEPLGHWQVQLQKDIRLESWVLKESVQDIQGDFEKLTVKTNTMRHRDSVVTIQKNGWYEWKLSASKGLDAKDITLKYRLLPEHLVELNQLLESTGWLTASVPERSMIKDGTEYSLTLKKDGEQTAIKCKHGEGDTSYEPLFRLIQRINRQEWLFYSAAHDPEGFSDFIQEMKQEVGMLTGKSYSVYAPMLDYQRITPTFRRTLEKPWGRSTDEVVVAIDLFAYLKDESQFDRIVSLANDRDSHVRYAVADAMVRFGGERTVEVLQGMLESTADEAAWALVRLGDVAVPTLVKEIKKGTDVHNQTSVRIIRAYIDHWGEIPKPLDKLITDAVVEAMEGRLKYSTTETQYHEQLLDLANISLSSEKSVLEVVRVFIDAAHKSDSEMLNRLISPMQGDFDDKLSQLGRLLNQYEYSIREVYQCKKENLAVAVITTNNPAAEDRAELGITLNNHSGRIWLVGNLLIETPVKVRRVVDRILKKADYEKINIVPLEH